MFQDIPLLSSMIAELDSAIAGHTLIINSSTIVFQTLGWQWCGRSSGASLSP